MLSIFSVAYWPSAYIWRNICLSLLLIFKSVFGCAVRVLCIFWILTLYQYMICKYFLLFSSCIFHSFGSILQCRKFFNFDEVQFIYILFLLLSVHLVPQPSHKFFHLSFLPRKKEFLQFQLLTFRLFAFLVFCRWCKIRFHLPSLHVEIQFFQHHWSKTILSPLNSLRILVKSHLTIQSRVYFGVLCSTALI